MMMDSPTLKSSYSIDHLLGHNVDQSKIIENKRINSMPEKHHNVVKFERNFKTGSCTSSI